MKIFHLALTRGFVVIHRFTIDHMQILHLALTWGDVFSFVILGGHQIRAKVLPDRESVALGTLCQLPADLTKALSRRLAGAPLQAQHDLVHAALSVLPRAAQPLK